MSEVLNDALKQLAFELFRYFHGDAIERNSSEIDRLGKEAKQRREKLLWPRP